MKKKHTDIAVRSLLLSSLCLALPLVSYGEDSGSYNPASKTMPVIRAGDTSLLSSDDPSQYVGTIDPGNNAGLLNYCVQNDYVDSSTAMKDLLAYNKKVGAVVENETGNMPYAQGSAGELHANGHVYSVAMSTLPVRHNTCKAVYGRVQSTLKTPNQVASKGR